MDDDVYHDYKRHKDRHRSSEHRRPQSPYRGSERRKEKDKDSDREGRRNKSRDTVNNKMLQFTFLALTPYM